MPRWRARSRACQDIEDGDRHSSLLVLRTEYLELEGAVNTVSLIKVDLDGVGSFLQDGKVDLDGEDDASPMLVVRMICLLRSIQRVDGLDGRRLRPRGRTRHGL